jgi:large subunit ribosomal protein L28
LGNTVRKWQIKTQNLGIGDCWKMSTISMIKDSLFSLLSTISKEATVASLNASIVPTVSTTKKSRLIYCASIANHMVFTIFAVRFKKSIEMSKICQVTGKRPQSGNNVSHAKNRTKRKFYPNLHTKRFYIPEDGTWVTLKVSTTALRTINKNGITAVLKKAAKEGNVLV